LVLWKEIYSQVYLLPPATAQLEKRANINLKGWRKLAGFIGGFVFMAMVAAIFSTAEDAVSPPVAQQATVPQIVERTETAVDNESAKEIKDVTEVPVEKTPEPPEAAEVIEEPIIAEILVIDAELIERLNREIESLDEGVDFTGFYDNALGIQMGAALFGTWALMVEEGEQSKNPEGQALARKLKQKVSRFQTVQFPKLRKAYGSVVREQVWEHNVEVSVYGNANGIIQFTGYVFADNGNKKMIQEIVSDMLKLLRYDQSRFKWYKGDDEYTYFKLNTALDSKVMIIK
jgi:hypothetical protein